MEIIKNNSNNFEMLMKEFLDFKIEIRKDISKIEKDVSRVDDAIRGNGKIGLRGQLTALQNVMASKDDVKIEIKAVNAKLWKMLGWQIAIICAAAPIIAAFVK